LRPSFLQPVSLALDLHCPRLLLPPCNGQQPFRYSPFNQQMETKMNLRNLHRALLASAVTMLAFGAAPAMANTPFGNCVGLLGTDCTTANGHASVSVTSTLSVNEERAISFGNIAKSTPALSDTIVLTTSGVRTASAGFTPLFGASASPAGNAQSGAQSPGHYTVTGGAEDSATAVYISFADASGNPIDMCTSAGVCDQYHIGNAVKLSGPTGAGLADLTLDSFVINETSNDVYGHYITTGSSVAPGTTSPFLPGAHAATPGVNATAGVVDVVVGATLHGGGVALKIGKYVGNFDIMASY
jgi:hypothetical protein